MPSFIGIALDHFDRSRDKTALNAAMAAAPRTQIEIFWSDLAPHCDRRMSPDVPRRRANALNIEVGAPLPRCLDRSPDGRGLAWLWSGGDVLAYGHCCQSGCPRIST